jgi:hypothetical protein
VKFSPRLVLAALLLVAAPAPALAVRVAGIVRDPGGKPVELATVAAPVHKRGTVTDEQGRFELDLPAGPVTLEVSELGYEKRRIEVRVVEGLAALEVVLHEQPLELAEVTVAASSFGKAGKSEGATLRRMDVYTTPGGAADVFQSLRALPGINAPADGAALYVRGGEPSETLVRLDGGEIGHPYHYERASGGLFSSLDAYMLKSAFFSSGGFSSKYGGVLSGVLDIETQDPFDLRTVSLSANMAGAGVSSSWALVPERLSVVGSLRRSFPEVLFRLYGTSTEYQEAPTSDDGAGRLLWRYRPTGRLSFSWLDSGDRSALTAEVLNYRGPYASSTRNHLGALQLSDVIAGRIAVRAQASGQYYHSGWTFGSFGGARTERNALASVDAVWPIGARHELSFGGIERRLDTEIAAQVASDSTDFGPGAPSRPSVLRPVANQPGFYLEDKLRVWGPLYATLGGRVDRASAPGAWTADPRASLALRVDARQTVRVATGRYHQPADVRYLDPVYGNPDLGPLEADHLIAGYEWKSENLNLRVESFQKRYHTLVTNDSLRYYANGGTGFARGVDLFTQGSWHALSGWVSYGYLDSRRRQLDDPREVPSPWAIRHSLTLIGQVQWRARWQFGAHAAWSSGRPYTPVVDRSFDPTRSIWRPVYGEHGSALLPAYRRLDLRATRLFSLPAGLGLPPSSVCAAYVEALNVLNLKNVLEYVYDADYSRRIARDSYFSRRFLVAGFGLTW